MNFNIKYLILQFSIIVLVSGNQSDAVTPEMRKIWEQKFTNPNIHHDNINDSNIQILDNKIQEEQTMLKKRVENLIDNITEDENFRNSISKKDRDEFNKTFSFNINKISNLNKKQIAILEKFEQKFLTYRSNMFMKNMYNQQKPIEKNRIIENNSNKIQLKNFSNKANNSNHKCNIKEKKKNNETNNHKQTQLIQNEIQKALKLLTLKQKLLSSNDKSEHNKLQNTIDKLKKALNNSSNINKDIQSILDSINSEISTTKDQNITQNQIDEAEYLFKYFFYNDNNMINKVLEFDNITPDTITDEQRYYVITLLNENNKNKKSRTNISSQSSDKNNMNKNILEAAITKIRQKAEKYANNDDYDSMIFYSTQAEELGKLLNNKDTNTHITTDQELLIYNAINDNL
ncbi:MAG: hypothetical protein IJ848_03410 [Alphaproteobacteria bacterium]|nr:hypothetical protein [Alphaproteobacteria bacterium]